VARADRAMYRDKGERTGEHTEADASGRQLASTADASADHVATVLVPMLFRLGLSLHAAADVTDQLTASRLHDVVDELDEAIALLRRSALAHLRAVVDGPSVRTAFGHLGSAIAGAEHALRREWENGSTSDRSTDVAMRLVRSSRLLRAAERALEPDALG
jgi:hypothetical protein